MRDIRSRIVKNALEISDDKLNKFSEIDGWLTSVEGKILYNLARRVKKGNIIVEIGGWLGKSSCYISHGSMHGNNIPIYSIDPHQWTDTVNRKNTFKAWHEMISQFDFENIVFNIRKKSEFAVSNIQSESIGLLFIDGDHSKESVGKDIDNYAKILDEKGYIVFHDSFFDSVYDVLKDKIWTDFDYELVDYVDSSLIVQKRGENDNRSRTTKEEIIWLLLSYSNQVIMKFLKNGENALLEKIKSLFTQLYSK